MAREEKEEREVRSRISEEDIIAGYLRPKYNEEATANPGFIVDNMGEEVYTREPWMLPQPTDPMLNPHEWFYFGKGKWRRDYRQAEGAWIHIDCISRIKSKESGEVIGGTVRSRYFFTNKFDTTVVPSNWFMREYFLSDEDKPYKTPHRICKITCNI